MTPEQEAYEEAIDAMHAAPKPAPYREPTTIATLPALMPGLPIGAVVTVSDKTGKWIVVTQCRDRAGLPAVTLKPHPQNHAEARVLRQYGGATIQRPQRHVRRTNVGESAR